MLLSTKAKRTTNIKTKASGDSGLEAGRLLAKVKRTSAIRVPAVQKARSLYTPLTRTLPIVSALYVAKRKMPAPKTSTTSPAALMTSLNMGSDLHSCVRYREPEVAVERGQPEHFLDPEERRDRKALLVEPHLDDPVEELLHGGQDVRRVHPVLGQRENHGVLLLQVGEQLRPVPVH